MWLKLTLLLIIIIVVMPSVLLVPLILSPAGRVPLLPNPPPFFLRSEPYDTDRKPLFAPVSPNGRRSHVQGPASHLFVVYGIVFDEAQCKLFCTGTYDDSRLPWRRVACRPTYAYPHKYCFFPSQSDLCDP